MTFRLQKRIYVAAAGCIAFILFFTVFGEKGLLRIYELKKDKSAIDLKLVKVKDENDKLKREVVALQSDRRYLESIARRDLGMVRSNEVVYQFSPEKQ